RRPRRKRGAATDPAGAGRAGGDAAARRRRDHRLHARGGSRPEADLRRRRRDRDRGRLRGRSAAGRRRRRGPGPAGRRGGAGEGRKIARNIHRLGRLYLTKTVYAATLILLVAVPGFVFPFLPRHLTVAAMLTIGIPSFALALLPSEGPLYRGRLLRALAAFAVPAGISTALASILSFFLVDTVAGGTLAEGRTAATSTLIALGLAFILLLERGPGREHIAIQSNMLAMVL